jgi:two-component system sensor histidine kinase UhpB
MPKELKILIIEDVPADAEAIERELRSDDIEFAARRLETREELLRELKNSEPDIILSDFTLPDFNALEALRLLREQQYDIPFILVTGTRSEEVAVECLRQGADDYILKASLKRLPASVLGILRKKEAERKKAEAEAALRRSEEQFRLIAEHSRDLICLLNPMGLFLYANPAFESGLGYAPGELIGVEVFTLVHPDDEKVFRSVWRESLERREGFTAEFRARHRNGSCCVMEAFGNWIYDEGGTPQRSLLVSRDITKRKLSEEALRGLPKLIREAQEVERRRVARELHDSVIQILSSVKFRFQSVEDALADLDEQVHLAAAKASGLLERAIREVRRISQNLRPSELDDLGLIPALRSLTSEFQERLKVQVQLILHGLQEPLPKGLELNVYRIIQEAFNNIEKHARARQAELILQTSGSVFLVTIRDDGCGFDLEKIKGGTGPGAGMGLVDIEERAKMAGGWCAIKSAPGRGTEIFLEVPLPATSRHKPTKGSEKRKKK